MSRTRAPPGGVIALGSVVGIFTTPVAVGGTVTSSRSLRGVWRHLTATVPRTLSYEAAACVRSAGMLGRNLIPRQPGAIGHIPASTSYIHCTIHANVWWTMEREVASQYSPSDVQCS